MQTRRTFLQTAPGLSVAAALLPKRMRAAGSAPREQLREFGYGAVRLTGGPLQRQYDHLHQHYLGLDNDRILKVYRQRAGLPAPGDDMGGWYDADGFVPGHTIGQYISGLARFHKGTGDPAAAAKARALAEGYIATLGPNGYPYASEKGATTWPCYILDKYEIGLIDAYRLAGVQAAKDALPRVIRGAIGHIPDHTYDRTPDSPKQAPYDEPYILSENLFQSWEVTGEQQFFDMAKMYLLNAEYFEPLARGENILPGKHAYSHMIALSSAAKAYLVLGDEKYLAAIRNAWDMVEQTQQFASGGSGPKEAFVTPHEGKLGDAITSTHDHFETPCGCYAQVKLARYLLRITGEGRYGDGLERVLYNTVLGARDPDNDGNYFYYSNYQPGAKKGYYHRKWSCCSGTLAQGVADYPVNIYFQSASALYVNLFTPSEVQWQTGNVPVKLSQTGEGETQFFRVETAAPVTFELHVRVPGWVEAPPRVRVNGKAFDADAVKGFLVVRRHWKSGDHVEVTFPRKWRLQAVDDKHTDVVAIMRGPLMYVETGQPVVSDKVLPALPADLDKASLTPFHAVREQSYTTYFRKPA